jgi:DNA-binding response OmpR family regulator
MVTFKEISIDTNSRTVTVNGNEAILTPKEYELLLFFLINRNRVLTKDAIVEHLWSDHIEMAASIDFIYTHLNNLRKKIKQAGGTDHIRTIYGTGYKLSEE